MEKIARIFFVFTLLFAAAFIIFFLLYAQTKNEVTSSNVDKAALQQSVSTLNNDLNRQEVLYEELERKYNALKEAASETSEINIQKLKDQIYDQQKQIDDLQELISQKDTAIASLSQGASPTVTTAVVDTEQIAQVSADYEKEIDRLQDEISRQNEQIKALTAELESDDVDERIQQLQLTLSQHQSDLESAKTQISTYESRLAEREKEIVNLNEQLTQAGESAKMIAEKQKEIASLESEISALNQVIEENQQTIKTKDTELTELTGQLNNANTQIGKLNETLARERKYDPIPDGEADAVKYKYLLLGEDALSAGDSIKSADYFMRADLNNLALGDLQQVYSRKRELAFQKAIAEYYSDGYERYKNSEYSEALESFTKALSFAQDVQSNYRDDTLYYKALSEFNLQNYAETEKDLKFLMQTEKNSTYIPHALYYLAKVYEQLADRVNLEKTAKELSKYNQYSSYAKKILDSLN
ncbi:MAG TPA: hypothetical protein P5107_05005 [Thermotogota bacterium]|nr:hypothetical protein [Thermotogota bacterium]HRW34394.1 hypothetical protein [Thermotogota bacterium]